MPCSRSPGGGVYPSMYCRRYPSMPCSRSPGVCAIPACLAAGLQGGVCVQHMVNERPVRILLECILVIITSG